MSQDVLVSARIAQGKKEAAKAVLTSLGLTASDLINSAFDYVLENKELPTSANHTKSTYADFVHFVEESTTAVPWPDSLADGDYDRFIREEKLAEYESLA